MITTNNSKILEYAIQGLEIEKQRIEDLIQALRVALDQHDTLREQLKAGYQANNGSGAAPQKSKAEAGERSRRAWPNAF